MNKFLYNILAFFLKTFCKKTPVPFEESRYAKKPAEDTKPKAEAETPKDDADTGTAEQSEAADQSETAGPETKSEAAEDTAPGEAGKSGKKLPLSKKTIALIAGGLAAVLLLIVVVVMVNNRDKTTHVKLPSVVVLDQQTGINGRGEVSFKVDQEALKQALFPKGTSATQEQIEAYVQDVARCLTVKLPDTLPVGDMRLKNGDIVTGSVSFAESERSRFPEFTFEDGTFTYTVDGLFEGELIEPFAPNAFELVVEGNSGVATARFTKKLSGSYVYYLNYDWNPKTGLSNGDTVTVTIDPDLEKLAEFRYTVGPERSYEYIVSGLDEYVTDPTTIPAQLINSMVNYAESALITNYSSVQLDEMDKVVTEPEITSIYYFDKADKLDPYTDYFTGLEMNNCVMVLGHFFIQDIDDTPVRSETEEEAATQPSVVQTYGGYYAWIFPDVVRREDGTVTYNREMVKERSTSFQTESDFMADAKNTFRDFAITSIGANN